MRTNRQDKAQLMKVLIVLTLLTFGSLKLAEGSFVNQSLVLTVIQK